jgi:hypothetical protein
VEEAPVVSVPVVAPNTWLPETAPQPAPAPAQARFMSEEEEESPADNSHEDGFFFASAAPNVTTTLTVAAPQSMAASALPAEFRPERESASGAETQEPAAGESEPEFRTPPRDYVADFIVTPRQTLEEAMAEQAREPEPMLFSDSTAGTENGTETEDERDLDVPTFLRRLKF